MAARKPAPDPDSDGDNEADEDKVITAAREAYKRCREAWDDNQKEAKADLQFGRLSKQWDGQINGVSIEEKRRSEGKPCESFNKMPAFIRQVVNDARQNKPSVKVHPQDSGADKRVAEIYDGLIRNIETTSDADVAYDTAIEHAVGQGFGFWRINTAYTCDDAFDQDIVVERIANPFTVFGDPRSTSADSSDWNVAFIITSMSKDEFEREYPDAENTNWDYDFKDCPDWIDGDDVVIAEYWTREKVNREIVALSDGSVVGTKDLKDKPENYQGLQVVGKPRTVESYKVTQRIMTGAEVLKTVDWAGKYIPIVAVYGDEVIDETGKRHFRSLIRDAKGAQRMYNYMRNTGIHLLALQPRIPFIGRKGAFDSDKNWDQVNEETIPFLEFDGPERPTREPPPQGSQAVLQEALNANDDMKAIIGIYDASLGARSNETSGKAIMARQREGDVSTFHFIDNLSRAIRHCGRVLLDLIPKVYSTERMVRVLGEDLTAQNVQVAPTGQAVTPQPAIDPMTGQPQMDQSGQPVIASHIFDLTVGKYDLTVSSGPAYSTRRIEAGEAMMEMMQAAPQIIPLIGDIWAEQQDWPMADKIAERLKAASPAAQQQGGLPPQIQQQMQQGMQTIQQQAQQIAQLQQALKDKEGEIQVKAQQVQVHGYEAQTHRMEAMQPRIVPASAAGA